MLWSSAYNLMIAGKAIRSSAWRNNEFIVLCGGGVMPPYFNFSGLGVSDEVQEILCNMDSDKVRIVPHIIRFVGADLIFYDASLNSSDMVSTDWGIFNGHTTDFLVWESGTRLIDSKGKTGKIIKRIGDDIYYTFGGLKSTPIVSTIDKMYLEGIRVNNEKFN